MGTVEDLRAVFAEIEASAPTGLRDPERVLAPPRRRARREIAMAAAAVVVIGVGIGVAVTRGGNQPEPRPAQPRPTPTACPTGDHCPVLDGHGRPVPVPVHFTLSVASGIATPTARWITPSSEELALRMAGGGEASVRSYAEGAAPAGLVTGGPAEVPGHPGARYAHDVDDARKYLTWKQNGRTVVVLANSRVLELARGVGIVNHPVALPFRFDKLPAGLVPESILIAYASDGLPALAQVDFTDGRPTTPPSNHGRSYTPSFNLEFAAVGVQVASFPGAPPVPDRDRLEQQVAGHPAYRASSGHQLLVPLERGFRLQIAPSPDRLDSYGSADLVQLARDMSFATDPSDPSTWFTSGLFPK